MNDESVNLLDDQLDLPNISILNEEEWKTIIEEKRKTIVENKKSIDEF